MVMYDFFSMISFRLLILKSGVIFDREATEIISKWFIAFQVIIKLVTFATKCDLLAIDQKFLRLIGW